MLPVPPAGVGDKPPRSKQAKAPCESVLLLAQLGIRMTHQIQNFVRFCEAVIKPGTAKRIELTTGYDNDTPLAEIQEKLDDLQQSLLEMDVVLDIKLNPNLHDREIWLDNGWVIKIGRGLDFYQKPGSWFEVGASDLSLRKCLETKIDIYRAD